MPPPATRPIISQVLYILSWAPEMQSTELRRRLVQAALDWEKRFGVAPHITSAVAEYDVACIVGCSEDEYRQSMLGRTAVSKGFDFVFNGKRYQVKANRPSGKRGSKVTLAGGGKPAGQYECWDKLVWLLYDQSYEPQEAWLWDMPAYREAFAKRKRLSPEDMRLGTKLL
jgi:hypothetical protein